MKPLLALSIILICCASCISQNEDVHLSYPQIQARAKVSSYVNVVKIDTLLVFHDQFNEYAILKETRYRNDTIIKLRKYEFIFTSDTMDFYVESPRFTKRFYKLSTPIIDTVRHPEDYSIIVRLDTIKYIETDFAHSYKLDPDVYFNTIQMLEDLFKEQGISIVEVVVDCDLLEVSTPFRSLNEEHFENCNRIEVSLLISKNGEMVVYPILFEKTVANNKSYEK